MCRLVFPRTIESSMMITRLPSNSERIGLSLARIVAWRASSLGMMNVRPT